MENIGASQSELLQSFMKWPTLPQRKHFGWTLLVACRAASTSIGTGLPGVGAVWVKQVGKWLAGGKLQIARGGARGVVLVCGAAKWADWKAALAAWFWSKRIAALYQASGLRSSGLPEAIVAITSAIKGLSPLWIWPRWSSDQNTQIRISDLGSHWDSCLWFIDLGSRRFSPVCLLPLHLSVVGKTRFGSRSRSCPNQWSGDFWHLREWLPSDKCGWPIFGLILDSWRSWPTEFLFVRL